MMKPVVLFLVLTAACATAPTADTASSTTGKNGSDRNLGPTKSEVATGELEEALVKLSRVHFGLDSAVLLTEAQQALGDAGQILKKYPDVAIFVEGNSDERGTPEYNVALSEKRSRTVVNYLTTLGIAKDRLTIVPKGELDPLATGSDQAALAANRRVDFRLQRGGVKLVLQDGVKYDDKGQRIATQ